jgi:hypothetical protein
MIRIAQWLVVAVMLVAVGCDGEPAAWQQAEATDTVQAYESYLQDHADGAHAVQANTRLAELREQQAWQEAEQQGTIAAIETFLRRHPDGKHHGPAQATLEELRDARDWTAAQQADTLADYQQYLTTHPAGVGTSQAAARLRALKKQERLRLSMWAGLSLLRDGGSALLRQGNPLSVYTLGDDIDIALKQPVASGGSRFTVDITGLKDGALRVQKDGRMCLFGDARVKIKSLPGQPGVVDMTVIARVSDKQCIPHPERLAECTATLDGVAYHLQGGVWQPVAP